MIIAVFVIIIVIVLSSAGFIFYLAFRNIASNGIRSRPTSRTGAGTKNLDDDPVYGPIRRGVRASSDIASRQRIVQSENEIINHHSIPPRKRRRLENRANGHGFLANRAKKKLVSADSLTDAEIKLFHKMITPVNQKAIDKARSDPKKKNPKPVYHPGMGRVNPGTGETKHGIRRAGHRTSGHKLIINPKPKKKREKKSKSGPSITDRIKKGLLG